MVFALSTISFVAVLPYISCHQTDLLHECVLGISERYLQSGRIAVVYDGSMGYSSGSYSGEAMMKELFGEGKRSFSVINGNRTRVSSTYIGLETGYVVFLNKLKSFSDRVDVLVRSQGWNPRSLFLVVAPANTSKSDLLNVAKILWKASVYRAEVVKVEVRNGVEHVVSYSWRPFRRGRACKAPPEEVAGRVACRRGKGLWISRRLFPRFVDFQGCVFTVATFPYLPYVLTPKQKWNYTDGVDINLVNLLGGKLGLAVRFLAPPSGEQRWGVQLEDGSWTGMLMQIEREGADLATAGAMHQLKKAQSFDCSPWYIESYFAWVVPRAPFRAGWTSLVYEFEASAWAAVFSSYLLVSVFFYLVLRRSLGDVCLDTWRNLLGQGMPRVPASLPFSLSYATWSIFCVLIVVAYQSYFCSLLTDPGREFQVDTMEDLLASQYDVGFHPSLDVFFNDPDDPVQRRVMARRTLCMDVDKCIERVSVRGDTAQLVEAFAVGGAVDVYDDLDPALRARRVVMKEKVVTARPVMYLAKWHPVLERLEDAVRGVAEAGLVHKWISGMERSRLGGGQAEGVVQLSLKHLEGAFYVLGLGCSAAALAFLCERFACRFGSPFRFFWVSRDKTITRVRIS